MPAVTKLWNSRYRLEFYCSPSDGNEGWYGDNISKWLPSFGTLQSANFSGDGWAPRTGEIYSNMCLVEAALPYVPASEKHLVTLTYETLTTSWVLEKEEDPDYELNGLQRIKRTYVSLPGTAYTNVVGTTTITSGANTLYLGKYNIKKTEAKWVLEEVWLEAGVLSKSTSSEGDGIMRVTTVFFGVEGTVVGPVIEKRTSDFEGLPTISVTTLQDVNGDSIVNGSPNLVNSFESFIPFTYPGIINVEKVTFGATGTNGLDIRVLVEKSPAQCLVTGTTYIFFQTEKTITSADYLYESAAGLYSPNTWASVRVDGESTDIGGASFSSGKGFRGFRTSDNSDSGTLTSVGWGISSFLRYNGQKAVTAALDIDWNLDIDKGPPNPVGNKWVTDCSITLAFDDVDGVQYYKKKITVTNPIPTQPSTASLPYSLQ
jgi:hypothetical protein